MTISKITNPPSQKGVIDKVNEIIDNLGGGSGTVDQTYDATSTNAQSGVAIAGAGFLQNTATGDHSLTIDGYSTSQTSAINVGYNSNAGGSGAVVLGFDATAAAFEATAIGTGADVTAPANNAIQLGAGTNATANTFSVGFDYGLNYQLLDGSTGLIPYARIPYDNSTITVNSNNQLQAITRNIGEIVASSLPLTDAGLHLLDGAKLYGSGYNSEAFTVVGSPTITSDGIASGFSSDNYIDTKDKFYVDISENFEVHLKVNNMLYNPQLGDTGVFVFRQDDGTERFSFRFNGKTCYLVSAGSGNNTTSTGIKYFGYTETCDLDLIFGMNGTSFYAKYKTSYDNDWTNLSTTTISLSDNFGSSYMRFGTGFTPLSSDRGSIDLKQFSIIAGGNTVFSGNTGGIYSAFVDKIGEIYNNTTQKYSNVTKIGTLTDNNGVISGFSTSNYATLKSHFIPNSNPWDIVIKYTTSSVSTNQFIYSNGVLNSGNNLRGVRILIRDTAKLEVGLSFDGSTLATSIIGSTTLQANTTYTFKLSFTGSAYNLYVNDVLDGSYTSSSTVPNSIMDLFGVWWNGGNPATPALGAIDLNNSYIKINDTLFWSGMLPDGFTNELAWQTSVTQYGVCGKFVYDSVNNTVRLPKIRGIIEGTTDVTALGDLVEAGLPNIEGKGSYRPTDKSYGMIWYNTQGAIYSSKDITSSAFNDGAGGVSSGVNATFNLDASLSNPIYGNSNTVQPQTIKVFYYIVIATSTKTDNQVDIDEIATDLNGKADVDLTNVTPSQSFINTILNYGIPDWANRQSKTWNTTYTATTAGLVYCGGWTQNGNAASITINNVNFATSFTATSSAVGALIPFLIGAGDTYKASGTCTSSYLYWIPLKGVS